MRSPVSGEVIKIISDAVNKYNMLRSPEARAELLSVEPLGNGGYLIKVLFKGSFIETCGVRDWVEDLAYASSSLNMELIEVIEGGDGLIGVFIVKELVSD